MILTLAISRTTLVCLSLLAVLPLLGVLAYDPALIFTPWAKALQWSVVFVVACLLARQIWRRKRHRLPPSPAAATKVETFFQHRPEVTVLLDASGRISRSNQAFRALVGMSEARLVGQRLDEIEALNGMADYGFWPEARQVADLGKTWSRQTWGQRDDGSLFPEQIVIRALRDAKGKIIGYTLDSHDVSDLVMTKRELERSALQDPLTGLFNRRYLEAEAEQAIDRCRHSGQKLGLVLLDLDDFKTLNDRRGHQFGDEVLVHVAETLRSVVPLGDIIARLGGDEFVVVAEDVDGPEMLEALAEDIRTALSLPFAVQDDTLRLSASLGASLFPDDGQEFDALMGRADNAMYQCKQLGRNRVSLYAAARAVMARPVPIDTHAADLGSAVAEDGFIPYFQPLVDLTTREVVGAEALCRWQHPRHGLLPPSAFVAAAEANGTIGDIDKTIIRKACLQMSDWQDRGRGSLPISVNVSAATLSEPGFARFLQDCSSEYGVAPEDLVVELTESMVLLADDHGRRSLLRIRDLGFQVALDDFGTGFSTLALLKDLPVTRLKIDRSFVTQIDANRRDWEIVSSIVSLGRALGTDVVAEGVETESQAKAIAGIGDMIAQGYLFGKPMPAVDLAANATWSYDYVAVSA
ncbi:MAG: EAL domain-containing protein [Pseudomonadota bacterium]